MPQETNMAEVVRLLHTVIGKVDGLNVMVSDLDVKFNELDVKFNDLNVKVDGLAVDMKEVKSDVKKLGTRMGRLEGKVDIFYRQFQDVAGVAIKDTQRIDSLEERVGLLESKSH